MNFKTYGGLLFLGFIYSGCLGADPFEKVRISLTEVVSFLEEKTKAQEAEWIADSLKGPLIFDSWNKKEEKFLFLKGDWSIMISDTKVECIWIDKFSYLWKYELSQKDESFVLTDSVYMHLEDDNSKR